MTTYFYSNDKENWSNGKNLFELILLCRKGEIQKETFIWHKNLCPAKTELPENCAHLENSIKAVELNFLMKYLLNRQVKEEEKAEEQVTKQNEEMNEKYPELIQLFEEAKNKNEFEFVLSLINYRGMGTKKLTTNLHEWFEAIEFYKELYNSNTGKNKTRIGTLIYSTFFENSDFYNIIGSLCRIKLGHKGSSYLFWKTRKYERLLGIGEKQEFLLELLTDADKLTLITFFEDNHFKEIRNTFFHSAYSLSEEEYILHDSDPITINGIGQSSFNVEEFFYPKIDNVIDFFDTFKRLYLDSFDSYKENKQVEGFFPNPVQPIILGSESGLQGFKIEKSVQFFGEWHDSGIWYEEQYDMWAGHNINMYFEKVETIEIDDQLTRYENKDDIKKSRSS